jgi:hypothetical protein
MPTPQEDRQYWVNTLTRIARPVLVALSERRLKKDMPVEVAHDGDRESREKVTHLEALGRTLGGMAPWLEVKPDETPEGKLRAEYGELARKAIDAGTDRNSPDFMNFTTGGQPLVDAAFLAHAILRAPTALWQKLDERVRTNVVAALVSTRRIRPGLNNWLLFSAMVEACLCKTIGTWEQKPVDFALSQHEAWYRGDGVYGDGPEFHWDYYNSFVIQPMMIDVLEATLASKDEWPARAKWAKFLPGVLKRAVRFAEVQERLISPEGTFPPLGRSLAYRFGALQMLAQMALRRKLPDALSPCQVRAGMTAVIRRMVEAPGTFDAKGWLTIGFCGHQPGVAEAYISTGSLYLCTVGLLPLGLPPDDEFWTCPAEEWTGKRIWGGHDVGRDKALKE